MKRKNTHLAVQILGCLQMVSSITQTFTYTGSYQEFVVPATVTSIDMTLTGGQGGGNFFGAVISATVPVTAGETLYVFVGGAGSCATAAGGFNGGGAGTLAMFNTIGCGGGGGSDVRTDANDLSTRLATAGGSGGDVWSTEWGNSDGGEGGCPNGFAGEGTKAESNAYGGGGANQTHGGIPGYYSNDYHYGGAGTFGAGGAGGSDSSGGGGGGGYYGGGGGASTAGGGGSSYSPYSYSCSYYTSDDVYAQDGKIVFTYAVDYTFTYSSGSSTFTPPSDVTYLTVNVAGAAGADSATGAGGLGGFVAARFNTTSGTSYYVTVGNTQGYNGGGSSDCAGVGGGASSISTSSFDSTGVIPTSSIIVMAGGGGGAGYDAACTTCGDSADDANNIDGGSGGGDTAGSGAKDPEDLNSTGGGGGSQSIGGSGGSYSTDPTGEVGQPSQGGASGSGSCGGGGGGGYFGGGGGANTGGGGGSSYVQSQWTVLANNQGVHSGSGNVTITFKSTVYEPPVVTDDNDDDGNRKNQLSMGIVVVIFFAMLLFLCLCGAVVQKRMSAVNSIQAHASFVNNPVHK